MSPIQHDFYISDSDCDNDDLSYSDSEYSGNRTKSRYSLVLCEIFNPSTHGVDDKSDPCIAGHYLVHTQYNNTVDWGHVKEMVYQYKRHVLQNSRNPRFNTHPIIRNYINIITNKKYIQPEIAEVIYLSGQECVAVLKTFWFRIFQRICKKKIANNRLA